MATYEQFQNKANSEKSGLAIIEAARRLVGWSVSSGSIYVLSNFEHSVIVSIKDSGTAYTSVASIAAITAGTYYHDRDAQKLYLQASDSSNPNGRYLVCLFRNYFSHGSGIAQPHDLASGFDVYWRPLIRSTSPFGVKLDSDNQSGAAVEGSGSIKLINDRDYWKTRFDKWSFANKRVFIYSWNPTIPITEAKLLYQGTIQGQSYTRDEITFNLKDQFFELRADVALERIGDISGAIVPPRVANAYQRILYGHVKGHRPTNIDQILQDGYDLVGTVSITAGSKTITGSGTQFLKHLSPDDELVIDGLEETVSIDTVSSDTSATLTEDALINLSGKTYAIKPDHPKRYANREWIVAGHALREPTVTVVDAESPSLFEVTTTEDMEADAKVQVGSEIAEIRRIVPGNKIKLKTNLLSTPTAGTTVKRFAVDNVRINDRLLTFTRDYTVNASTGRLTLTETAERDVAQPRALTGTVTFGAATRTITGTGTLFTTQLTPNTWIRSLTQSTWHEVIKINSDTSAELRAVPGFTETPANCVFKNPVVYEEGRTVLSCDVLGATDNGTTSGVFLKTAPQIVQDLLTRAGLAANIDAASFDTAKDLAQQKISVVFPEGFGDTRAPTYRKAIEQVNRSVFGALIQTPDFQFQYHVFRPGRKQDDATVFRETDTLKWSIKSKIDKIVKAVELEYLFKEYDWESADESKQVATYSNKDGQYLAESRNTFTHETNLVDATDAQNQAQRWALLLSVALTNISIETKMKGARLKVTDVIDLRHEKIYERIASATSRKVGAISSAEKDLKSTKIVIEDLANAFSRCGVITTNDAPGYDDSNEDQKFYQGFITDTYGMQGNDPYTHGVNLIW